MVKSRGFLQDPGFMRQITPLKSKSRTFSHNNSQSQPTNLQQSMYVHITHVVTYSKMKCEHGNKNKVTQLR